MRWIYISPHLDDAVLSAGGLIHDQAMMGIPVEIWTLACGFPPEGGLTPFAQDLHFQWGFSSAEETIRLRRAEDLRAAATVGAKAVHFDFLDCIYRRGPDGEVLYSEGVFTPIHAAEAGYPAQITAALARVLERGDVVVCPLGIGGHVDHVVTRAAVEGLTRPLLYYADFPYLMNYREQLAAKSMGLRPSVHPVSEEGLQAWQEGIATYVSQLGTLFEDDAAMRAAMRGYWAGLGGIRLWEMEQTSRP
jgi:LmbE family N-acetylglucosaminyl deacetylase